MNNNNNKDNTADRIYDIIRNWLEVVKRHDAKKISELYGEQGVLLGTVAENVKQGRGVIKTYFDNFVLKHPEGVLNSIIFKRLGDKYGVADGNYTFTLDDDGIVGKKRKEVPARFTFVINLDNGLIESHHSSSTPKNSKPTDI
jgi:uncharacterized protein (TIGR02246 family)